MADENIIEATQENNGENNKQKEVSEITDGHKAELATSSIDETIEKNTEGKAEPVKKAFHRNTRPPRTGASANGNFDQKESFRHARYRKKMCRFCLDKNLKVNYRDTQILGNYITERGKILPRRITGTCSKHQRDISRAIKRARILAVLPFSVK
jgi:small subunit ribosomal protein S18